MDIKTIKSIKEKAGDILIPAEDVRVVNCDYYHNGTFTQIKDLTGFVTHKKDEKGKEIEQLQLVNNRGTQIVSADELEDSDRDVRVNGRVYQDFIHPDFERYGGDRIKEFTCREMLPKQIKDYAFYNDTKKLNSLFAEIGEKRIKEFCAGEPITITELGKFAKAVATMHYRIDEAQVESHSLEGRKKLNKIKEMRENLNNIF